MIMKTLMILQCITSAIIMRLRTKTNNLCLLTIAKGSRCSILIIKINGERSQGAHRENKPIHTIYNPKSQFLISQYDCAPLKKYERKLHSRQLQRIQKFDDRSLEIRKDISRPYTAKSKQRRNKLENNRLAFAARINENQSLSIIKSK